MNVTGNEVPDRGSETVLCLTLNRTSQQARPNKKKTKKLLQRDIPFTMLKDPPKYCRKYALALLKFKNREFLSAKFVRMLCHSWRCPYCAPIRALYVSNLIRSVIILNDMKYTLCITLDPNKIPLDLKDRTQKYITKLFNTLFTELRRKYGTIKYMWVMEFQPLNTHNAHIHMTIDKRLDIVEVRKIWVRIGGGQQMRIDPIRNLISTAHYMSKYIIKSVTDIKKIRLYLHEKRYGISQSCIRPQKTSMQFFPELTNIEKQAQMEKMGLGSIYNMLIKEEFSDGEEITAQQINHCLSAVPSLQNPPKRSVGGQGAPSPATLDADSQYNKTKQGV